ncbi:MAG: hypothetical protein U1E17_23275 [Geminicoccaceae bacterium]
MFDQAGDRNRSARLASAIAAALALTMPAAGAQAGTTERVSVTTDGAQVNKTSFGPIGISASGRFVAFVSEARSLVPDDTNDRTDVFVHDRLNGQTQRASIATSGAQANDDSPSSGLAISADGRIVAFDTQASNLVPGATNSLFDDIFVRNLRTGRTEQVSLGMGSTPTNGVNLRPALSATGRFVAFDSNASNLVRGDTNGAFDVFLSDRRAGQIERISVATGGAQGNDFSCCASISADGRFVAFESGAANLVPGDTNGVRDVFVRDRQTGRTERISLRTGGGQGDDASFRAAISADGRFVAFESDATNLVPGDTNGVRDIFIRDRQTGRTARVSLGVGDVQADLGSARASISSDGRFVAFESDATNLVPGDTNRLVDVFVRDRLTGRTERVSVSASGAQGNNGGDEPMISGDGRSVAFLSFSTNLVPGDTNKAGDIFVRTR